MRYGDITGLSVLNHSRAEARRTRECGGCDRIIGVCNTAVKGSGIGYKEDGTESRRTTSAAAFAALGKTKNVHVQRPDLDATRAEYAV